MAIISPDQVVFETDKDVIDYVSRGMVPTKKNFEKVMYKLLNPDDEDCVKSDGDVRIPQYVLMDCDAETMEFALRRVYENRVHNRNMVMGAAGIVGGLVLLSMFRSHKKKKHNADIELGMNCLAADICVDDGPDVSI